MWMSRNAASTGSRVSSRIASAPDAAWWMTPMRGSCPSRNASSSIAGCSSSAMSTEITVPVSHRWPSVRRRRMPRRGRAATSARACAPGCPRPRSSRRRARARRRRPAGGARRRCAGPRARRSRRRRARVSSTSGSMPTPSSSTLISANAPGVGCGDRDAAAALLRLEAVPHGVLDERLDREERHDRREHLGGDLQRHLQPVAEPGALEAQVAVDRAQLLGHGREVAVPAERVAREVGELEHELAGLRGVGVDERRDRVERVVDEVRADLRAERAHLGLGERGARGVELAELDLRGDPVGHLAGRAHEAGPHGRRERDDGADGPAAARGSARRRHPSPGRPMRMRRCTCGLPDALASAASAAARPRATASSPSTVTRARAVDEREASRSRGAPAGSGRPASRRPRRCRRAGASPRGYARCSVW